VERQYALLNVNREDSVTWAEGVALKVKGLLDDAGPTNMAFTDGPSDLYVSLFFFRSQEDLTWILQGNPGRWNHPCCEEIISKFLFENQNSLGHKFTARFGPPLTTELVAFGHTMVNRFTTSW
jgi:hypothetical protein